LNSRSLSGGDMWWIYLFHNSRTVCSLLFPIPFHFHVLSTVWMLISFLPTNLQPSFHHISNALVSVRISIFLSYRCVYKPLVLVE
jgi:hypothetical protein